MMNLKHDRIETKFVRKRAYLKGQLVGLSCKVCEEVLPLSEFSNMKIGFANKNNTCKSCDRKVNSEWLNNNRDRKKQYLKKYSEEQPHKKLTSHHNHRARKAGTEDNLDQFDTETILASAGVKTVDGVKLARCQVTGEWSSNYDLCHVQSLKVGGNSEYSNMFVATRQVNCRQGNEHLLSWLLTESAYELTDSEYVQWLVTNLAQRNQKSVEDYVCKVIGDEGYEHLLQLYFD